MQRRAEISDCRLYRYALWREWLPTGKAMTFVMLNPSMADARIDDATIRKCIGFASRWGYGKFMVVNVMAFRTTDPANIPHDAERAMGPENRRWLIEGATYGELVMLAWGAPRKQFQDAYRIAEYDITHVADGRMTPVECLGLTKELGPKHPVRLPYDTRREAWPRTFDSPCLGAI